MDIHGAPFDMHRTSPHGLAQVVAREHPPGCSMKWRSRRYAVGPKWIGRPLRLTRWPARSMTMPPTPSDAAPLGGAARRSTAPIRATSSETLKGFTT